MEEELFRGEIFFTFLAQQPIHNIGMKIGGAKIISETAAGL